MSSAITALVSENESETLEFKASRVPLEALARAVCGMLNQRGGVVLWGLSEKKEIQGIAAASDRVVELNRYIMEHINPRPFLSVTADEIANQQVVAIEVPEGSEKPYS